jgi:hypothetical protein
MSSTYSATSEKSLSFYNFSSANIDLSLGGSARFMADLGYKFNYAKTGDQAAALTYALDAFHVGKLVLSDSLEVAEAGIKPFAFSFGRFAYRDPSATVYSGNLDGLEFKLGRGNFLLYTDIGYTGLLLKSDASITMSIADLNNLSDAKSIFCSPRAVGAAGVVVPNCFGQRLEAVLIAQEDLGMLKASSASSPLYVDAYDTTYTASLGGLVNTQYLVLSLKGAPIPSLQYSFFAIGEAGDMLSWLADSSSVYAYRNSSIGALSFGLNLIYSVNEKLSAEGRVRVSTGDPDATSYIEGNGAGSSSFFSPITTGSWGQVFSPAPGNVSSLEGIAYYRLFPEERVGWRSLSLNSRSILFMKTGKGPVSESGIELDAKSPLLGIEEDIGVSASVFSDLNAGISLGFFIPFKRPVGAFDSSYSGSAFQYSLRVDLALSL